MNRSLVCLLACLALLLGASLALAEGIVAEVYRSPHGWSFDLAVDPSDGSCWAVTGRSVVHLEAEGHLLQQYTGAKQPMAIALNTSDGSCWVADMGTVEGTSCVGGAIAHLSRDGAKLWQGVYWAISLSVDQRDGSLWFVRQGDVGASNSLVHLSASGEELGTLTTDLNPGCVAVSALDGSLWVLDWGDPSAQVPSARLVHLRSTGAQRGEWPDLDYALSVNPTDGSCWAGGGGGVAHLSASDEVLWSSDSYAILEDVAVNPADGSCWVQFYASEPITNCAQTLALLDASGSEVRRLEPPQLGPPRSLAISPVDGSLWMGAGAGWAHLAADGSLLWQDRGLPQPGALAVDPTDGSYWIATGGECGGTPVPPWVARYDALGNEMLRETGLDVPFRLALDFADESLWVVDEAGLTHFAADGTQLAFFTTGGGSGPSYAIVDPRDHSVWACDTNQIEHHAVDGTLLQTIACDGLIYDCQLAPDGSLWAMEMQDIPPYDYSEGSLVHIGSNGTVSSVEGIVRLQSLSVDLVDGSVWASDFGTHEGWEPQDPPRRVTHLAADGTVLWQGGTEYDANRVAVDPRNGNCWAVGRWGAIYLLSPAGEELGHTERANYYAIAATVNPADGTLWVLDENSQLCRIASSGPFTDVAATSWAAPAVSVCAAADVVKGYWDGSYHPEQQVTRDQMAVYIARALCGSDADVPDGPSAPSFGDVAPDSWAYKQIEYCKAQNIVQGYNGDYQPGGALDRAQMATFLARAIVPFADRPDLTSYTAPSTPSFPDVASDFWAYKAIEYVRLRYVAAGYPDGKYHPEYACTRDQMAVFVARAFHLFQ